MTTTMTAPAGRQRIYLTSGIYDTAADGTIAIPDTEIAACMSCGYTLVTSSSTSGVTYKGAVACAADPNYPAAVVGDQYKVSSAGHIGGASGPVVEIGDVLECITATVAGDHATVGTKWLIGQTNIEKPVRGPASTVTSGALCLFDGTTGDLVKQATALPTGTSIATLNCTTLDTNVAAAGVTLAGTTLAADGTDADISITVTPKGTGSVVISKADINGGTVDALTALSIRDTSAAFDVTFTATSSVALNAGRAITLDVVNGARTLKLGGNLTLTGALTFVGAYGATITLQNTTAITLPKVGTIQTAITLGGEHTTSREENVAGLSSAITLCSEMLTKYSAHVLDWGASAGEHLLLHSAAQPASLVYPTTLAELITRTNDLQTVYALHDTDAAAGTPTYHVAQASAHTLANATAVTTLQTAITKLNDLKTKYNLHEGSSTSHRTGGLHTITSGAAAYDVAIAITATGAKSGDVVQWSILNDGTGNVTGVSGVAGTDKITFTFSADPQNDTIISYLCVPVGR